MKKSIKRLLLGIAVSATAAFAVVASGCSASDKVEEFFNQLTCEHKNKEVVAAVAPTCTEDGYTEHEHCLDCDKDIKKVVIEATGHTLETVKGYEATCTTMGLSDGSFCTVCEETVTEQKRIAALGHKKVEIDEKKATCTEDGYTAGVICDNGCGTVYEGCEVIPAGHVLDEDGTCKVCKKALVINLADIQNGMDLSGYGLRYAVDEETFFVNATQSTTTGTWSISCSVEITFFEVGGCIEVNNVACVASVENFENYPGLGWDERESFQRGGDGKYYPAGSVVSTVNFRETAEEILRLFEFYYIGLPETDNATTATETNNVTSTSVSYALNRRAYLPVDNFHEKWTKIY